MCNYMGRTTKSRMSEMLRDARGQISVEMAFLVPVLLLILFGAFELGRLYYTYHSLQKALRGGAGVLARASNVNYCDTGDPALTDIKNMIVFGNLQGSGDPVIQGLTPEMIVITPERTQPDATTVDVCPCGDTDGCDPASGGHAPDFVLVSLGPTGFPLNMALASVNFGTFSLKVSVRMPVTGG